MRLRIASLATNVAVTDPTFGWSCGYVAHGLIVIEFNLLQFGWYGSCVGLYGSCGLIVYESNCSNLGCMGAVSSAFALCFCLQVCMSTCHIGIGRCCALSIALYSVLHVFELPDQMNCARCNFCRYLCMIAL